MTEGVQKGGSIGCVNMPKKKKSKYVQHVHKRGTEKLWVLELKWH